MLPGMSIAAEGERVHADVVLAHLDRGGLREAVDAALGRCVEAVRRSGRDAARDGRHVEDRAASAASHCPDLVLEAEEQTLEVGRDELVEGALGSLGDFAELLRTGVVDRAVEAAVRLERTGHERLDLLFTGNIGRREVDRASGPTDLLRRRFTSVPVHIAGDDSRPVMRKRLREHGAAAARRPGDQDDLAGE
jgi:hypothetical protein